MTTKNVVSKISPTVEYHENNWKYWILQQQKKEEKVREIRLNTYWIDAKWEQIQIGIWNWNVPEKPRYDNR